MQAPEYLGPLALIFLAALGAAYLLHRVRQPPMIGFLVAGALLGPFGLRLLAEIEVVETLAELGVVLLLFTVGLELSAANLRKLSRIVWIAGPIQVGATIALALAVGTLAGNPPAQALFVGFFVATSSTAIVLKLLLDRRELDSPQGKILAGVLIFQDLAVVPMLLSLNYLAGRTGAAGLPLLVSLGKTLLTAALLVLVARVLLPRFIGALAGTRQKEIFVVTVLFIVLGSAIATSWAGLSAALGAFLAGLVLSETEYGHQAMADVAPLRDAFSALFFVSIGMLFNPRVLLTEPVVVAVLLGLILVGKTVAGGAAVLSLGYGARVALVVGISLAQIGEFSFVVLRQGLRLELISPESYQAFLAVAILTMVATPFLSEASHALALRVKEGAPRAKVPGTQAPPRDHVLVIGFGHMGQSLARVLQRAGAPFRVIDLDPERVKKGRARGVPIEFGDATSDVALRRAGVEAARAVIVLISEHRAGIQAVRHCRSLNPKLFILARTRYLADIPALAARGADEVVAEEFETSLEIASRTLKRLGFSLPWIESETDDIRGERTEKYRRFRLPDTETPQTPET